MPLAFTQKVFLVTARIRSMTGRYCFHRCLSVNISEGGGYLVSDFRGGGYLVSDFRGGGGYLVSDFWGGVPGLRFSGGGYLVSDFRGGYLVSDFRGGGTRSMATRRAVCLLRSRRRTFLFLIILNFILTLLQTQISSPRSDWRSGTRLVP